MKLVLTGVTAVLILMFAIGIAVAGEKTVVLTVEGITCGSTEMQARYVISEITGVVSYETNIDEQTATVTYDDEVTDIDKIKAAMESGEFSVSEVKFLE